jgi:WD40 repeat protein
MASIRGLFITVDYVAFVKSETEILFRKNNGSDYTFQTISAISPIISLTISSSFLLAGSRSGKIFAWSSKSGSFIFELQGHNSAVNDIILDGPTLFSASDDMMIIQWSLEERLAIKVLRRLSATSLGHLGPVNSLIICERALFSGGADLTTRRWNLNTGAHEDVYFGPTKAINSVLCHNQSVFSGSEDFAVYNYFPYFDVQKRSTVDAKISSSKKRRETLRVRLSGQDNQFGVSSDILAIISAAVMIVIITASLFLYYLVWKRKKRNAEPRNHEFTSSDTNSSSFGLTTIVNSSIGISKHAALEIPSSSVASLKKLAAGGGGEVYLATLMDSKLVEKHGSRVVQKIVCIRSKISEEAFFQEVGIMILLSSYPNFCQIIGYTLNPIAMILKYYPTGSLKEWCTNNSYGKNAILKILSEVSGALGTMHNHHIAHCDIKPQNVLIELKEIYPTCFLTDFGITQILSEQVVATKMFHIINQRGVSLYYAAPEAINNFKTKKYARANYKCYDIYSFACIIYEVSSKKAPWAY